jgi:hypothetical protein
MAMHPSTNLLCVLRPRYSISPVGVERSLSPEVAFSLRKSHPVHLLKLHRSWRNALERVAQQYSFVPTLQSSPRSAMKLVYRCSQSWVVGGDAPSLN